MEKPPVNSVAASYQPGVELDDLQLILECIPSDTWAALRNHKIFITGGTGFIGCWLLEALIWANQELELNITLGVLTRHPAGFIAKAPHLATHAIVSLIQGDVVNLTHIQGRYDCVIHAATDVAYQNENPFFVFNSIVQGAQETLSLAQRCGAQRYLLTSSGAVYGKQSPLLAHISEDYVGAPDTLDLNNAYGHGKRAAEWLSHTYGKIHHIDVKVARCFALVGPYLPLDAHFAVGNFIRDGLNKQTIAVNGDGTSIRSYLYAADMVVWLLTILVSGQAGRNYNVGSAQGISIGVLAELVSTFFYDELNVAIAKQPVMNAPVQSYVPNVDRAHNELMLRQYTDLNTAIKKTIAWEVRRQSSGAGSC